MPHPSDRRRVTVQLTEAGLVIVEETRRLAASFRRVPESELVHVAAVLSTMAADLRDELRAIAERNAESTV